MKVLKFKTPLFMIIPMERCKKFAVCFTDIQWFKPAQKIKAQPETDSYVQSEFSRWWWLASKKNISKKFILPNSFNNSAQLLTNSHKLTSVDIFNFELFFTPISMFSRCLQIENLWKVKRPISCEKCSRFSVL